MNHYSGKPSVSKIKTKESSDKPGYGWKDTQRVALSPQKDIDFLAVEIELFPAEYADNCEPEKLHQIVEWMCCGESSSFSGKKAWMRFTNRGIIFEEQEVDFCDQIASSTLYKIKNVKGIWVDPTFRPFLAIVIRCSRTTLMIFVVRIISASIADIVESFHVMKHYRTSRRTSHSSKQLSSDFGDNVDRMHTRTKSRHANSRESNYARKASGTSTPDDRNQRNAKYRSTSIDGRICTYQRHESMGRRQNRERTKRVKAKRSDSNGDVISRGVANDTRDRASSRNLVEYIRPASSNEVERKRKEPHAKNRIRYRQSSCTPSEGSNSDNPVMEARGLVSSEDKTSSLPPSPTYTNQQVGQPDWNESRPHHGRDQEPVKSAAKTGAQYEELKTPINTTEDMLSRSLEYSSINSQFRKESVKSDITSDHGSSSRDSRKQPEKDSKAVSAVTNTDSPPIDALFKELHVVREQLEQLKVPESERMSWFETGMEQMKAELKQIRAKLDNCVITQKEGEVVYKQVNCNELTTYDAAARQGIIRLASSSNLNHDLQESLLSSFRPGDQMPLESDNNASSAVQYENLDFLKRVANFPANSEFNVVVQRNRNARFKERPRPNQTVLNRPHQSVIMAPGCPMVAQRPMNRPMPPGRVNNAQDLEIKTEFQYTTAAILPTPSKPNEPQIGQPVRTAGDPQVVNPPGHQVPCYTAPPSSNIPFMTPFFASQLTNPMLSNNRTLLLNTLANQFGLAADSPELLTIAADQGRYFSGRRTFANIIWNMDVEEEKILRTKTPSPLPGLPFTRRTMSKRGAPGELYKPGGTRVTGILVANARRNEGNQWQPNATKRTATNKAVSFCLAASG